MHGNSEKDFKKVMMNFIFGYKEEKSSLQYDVIWFATNFYMNQNVQNTIIFSNKKPESDLTR